MSEFSRRDFLCSAIAPLVAGASCPCCSHCLLGGDVPGKVKDIHQQILELAARHQEERRKRFAAVASKADLEGLQKLLRRKFLDLLDGLPPTLALPRKGGGDQNAPSPLAGEGRGGGPPPARVLGRIDGDDHSIDKLVFESFPAYYVSALLYRPKKLDGKRPGIISPCGHSAVGKAAATYQTLHVNLVKRGYVVLTYDPVGQGERSQFWDAGKGRSRFNLVCGEHAVLGNPLYLLGTSLARYRIFDGIRAIDYLASLPEVDAERIGCVGNSGGGTLTAYISALDPRVRVSVPSCYITTLPRRMDNRIEKDPDADPEQDIFGFVSQGIDHAGLLALMVPRPTLVNAARFDFFPIEGTRETFAEVKKLYEVAGAGEQFALNEADEKHGLSLALRQAAYAWFDRWLADRKDGIRRDEIAVVPRPAKELQVTPEGQVNTALKSRPLLPLALELFQKQPKPPRRPLKDLLALDLQAAASHSATIGDADAKAGSTLVLCINGNEGKLWQEEKDFLKSLTGRKLALTIIDPRGVGTLRPPKEVKGKAFADPLAGVEENMAYNAFLVGQSLLGMRVSDVLKAISALPMTKQLVLCGRGDAGLVACFAAAVEPRITHVAVEEMRLSYLPLFAPAADPINAASILPRLLRDFGDIPDVLAAIAPRKTLLAACPDKWSGPPGSALVTEKRFTAEPSLLLDWVKG